MINGQSDAASTRQGHMDLPMMVAGKQKNPANHHDGTSR